MRTDRVLTLARFHGARVWRQMGAVAAAVTLLGGIDVAKHGLHFMLLVPWLLGGAVMLPPLQGVLVIRDKFDGSLRFLASLPVAGAEHVAARALVSALLALPAGALAWLAIRGNAPMFSAGQAVGVAIATWLALAVVAMVFTALQMKTKVGQGMRVMLLLFVGLMIAGQVVPAILGPTRIAALQAAFLTPTGFAAASAALWLLLAATTWWAVHTMALISESYQSEGVQEV